MKYMWLLIIPTVASISCSHPPPTTSNTLFSDNTQCQAIRHKLHSMSVPTAAHRSPYGYGANTIDYAELMNQYEAMNCTSDDDLLLPPNITLDQ